MDDALLHTLFFFGGIAAFFIFIGYNIGYSEGLSDCNKNPSNVEYWKTKYNETQKENEFLKSQIVDVLVNSYAKNIVYSVTGLSKYRIICTSNYSSFLENSPDIKGILDSLCKPQELNPSPN